MTEAAFRVSLREYVESRIAAICQTNDLAHSAIERAMAKTEEQLRERLATMNEHREQLRDQADTFATRELLDILRSHVDTEIDGLKDDIGELQRQQAAESSRFTQTQWLVGVFFAIVSVALHFLAP